MQLFFCYEKVENFNYYSLAVRPLEWLSRPGSDFQVENQDNGESRKDS